MVDCLFDGIYLYCGFFPDPGMDYAMVQDCCDSMNWELKGDDSASIRGERFDMEMKRAATDILDLVNMGSESFIDQVLVMVEITQT